MCHGECRDDDHERPQAPERDDEAEQEQQVIDASEDVLQAGQSKTDRGLVPARIKVHNARITRKFKGALRAPRRQKTQYGRDIAAETIDTPADRELGAIRADRIFEQHVEELLVPDQVDAVCEPWPVQVCDCFLIRRERSIRWQRDQRLGDARLRQWRVVLVNGDVVGEIKLHGCAERLIGAGDFDEAGAALGNLDVDECGHGQANEQVEAIAGRLEECIKPHVRRNLMRRRGAGKHACSQHGQSDCERARKFATGTHDALSLAAAIRRSSSGAVMRMRTTALRAPVIPSLIRVG